MKINTPKQIYNKSKWETLKNDFNFRSNADMNYAYGNGKIGSEIWRIVTDGVSIFHSSTSNNSWRKVQVEKNGQPYDISNIPIKSIAHGYLKTQAITEPVFIAISDTKNYYTSEAYFGLFDKFIASFRPVTEEPTETSNQIIWDGTKFCLFGDSFIQTATMFDKYEQGKTSAKFELVEDTPQWYFEKCIFANSLYVAYINNNKKYSGASNVQGFSVSSDLETWSDIVSVPEINTTNGTKIYLAYSDGKYIAVTSDGVKAESDDGESWSVNDDYIQSVNNVVALPDKTLSILAGTNDNKTIQYKAKGDDYFAEKVFNWQSSDVSQTINPAYMTFDTEWNKLVLASVGANGILTKNV